MEDVRSKMEELLSHTFKAIRHEPELQDQQALMPRPSVTSSSNRGKMSRISKIFPACRTKSDNALPRCSTFAMSKGEQGRIAHSNSLKR